VENKFKIEILYDASTGNITLNGPLNNKGLCYMMLELAKDVCREAHEKLKKEGEAQIIPGRFDARGTPLMRNGG
jgi:hypothetical protein